MLSDLVDSVRLDGCLHQTHQTVRRFSFMTVGALEQPEQSVQFGIICRVSIRRIVIKFILIKWITIPFGQPAVYAKSTQ